MRGKHGFDSRCGVAVDNLARLRQLNCMKTHVGYFGDVYFSFDEAEVIRYMLPYDGDDMRMRNRYLGNRLWPVQEIEDWLNDQKVKWHMVWTMDIDKPVLVIKDQRVASHFKLVYS